MNSNDENYMNNLVTLYKQRLNLQSAAFTRIDHNDAMVAIVFKVTKSTNESLEWDVENGRTHTPN